MEPLAEFVMTLSSEQPSELIVSEPVAQRGEAFVHGRQGDFRVRLPGLCTDAFHGVVGQHEMGRSTQVVVKDG